jgi:hypothetical protein
MGQQFSAEDQVRVSSAKHPSALPGPVTEAGFYLRQIARTSNGGWLALIGAGDVQAIRVGGPELEEYKFLAYLEKHCRENLVQGFWRGGDYFVSTAEGKKELLAGMGLS